VLQLQFWSNSAWGACLVNKNSRIVYGSSMHHASCQPCMFYMYTSVPSMLHCAVRPCHALESSHCGPVQKAARHLFLLGLVFAFCTGLMGRYHHSCCQVCWLQSSLYSGCR